MLFPLFGHILSCPWTTSCNFMWGVNPYLLDQDCMIFAALCDVKHPKVQMIQKVASVDVSVGGRGCDQCR